MVVVMNSRIHMRRVLPEQQQQQQQQRPSSVFSVRTSAQRSSIDTRYRRRRPWCRNTRLKSMNQSLVTGERAMVDKIGAIDGLLEDAIAWCAQHGLVRRGC